jgi:hypothetical protein
MGLIPLTLKDLAWPERRIVAVSRDLPAVADTLVRALGIVPAVVGPAAAKHAFSSSRMYHWAYSHPLPWQRAMVTAGSIFLLLLYATMVVLEVYSKRSALGCVYPASIFSWQLVALIPAALTTLFRHRTAEGKLDPASEVQLSVTLDPEQEAVMFPSARVNSLASLVGKVGGTPLRRSLSTPALTSFHQPSRISSMAYPSHRSRGFAARVEAREFEPRHSSVVQTRFQNDQNDDISAVHGRGMLWIVPFSWGVYYVAGTLVYSSIMAVTVIELCVWVVVSFSVAVTSKILALLICTLFEKRWKLVNQLFISIELKAGL